jgi:hypothetical protein
VGRHAATRCRRFGSRLENTRPGDLSNAQTRAQRVVLSERRGDA